MEKSEWRLATRSAKKAYWNRPLASFAALLTWHLPSANWLELEKKGIVVCTNDTGCFKSDWLSYFWTRLKSLEFLGVQQFVSFTTYKLLWTSQLTISAKHLSWPYHQSISAEHISRASQLSIVCSIAHLVFTLYILIGIWKKRNHGVYKSYRVLQIRMAILLFKNNVLVYWFVDKWNESSKKQMSNKAFWKASFSCYQLSMLKTQVI